MRLRVCICTPFYSEKFIVKDLARSLKDRGFSVIILTPCVSSRKFSVKRDDRVILLTFPVKSATPNDLGTIVSYGLRHLAFTVYAATILRKRGFENRHLAFGISPGLAIFQSWFLSLYTGGKRYLWLLDKMPECLTEKIITQKYIQKILNCLLSYVFNFVSSKFDYYFFCSPEIFNISRPIGATEQNSKVVFSWGRFCRENTYSKKIFNKKVNCHTRLNICFMGNFGFAQNVLELFHRVGACPNVIIHLVGDGSDKKTALKCLARLKANYVDHGYVDTELTSRILEEMHFGIVSVLDSPSTNCVYPRRFFGFLESRLPVLVFGHRSLCDFVVSEGVGVPIPFSEDACSDSLDLQKFLGSVNEKTYQDMVERVDNLNSRNGTSAERIDFMISVLGGP